jgi:toxin ParE1/3/4
MKVVWSEKAKQQAKDILTYVYGYHREAAKRIYRLIHQDVAALSHAPYQGRPGRVSDTRELVILGTPYLVAYSIDAQERIIILEVRHGARQWPDRFDA